MMVNITPSKLMIDYWYHEGGSVVSPSPDWLSRVQWGDASR